MNEFLNQWLKLSWEAQRAILCQLHDTLRHVPWGMEYTGSIYKEEAKRAGVFLEKVERLAVAVKGAGIEYEEQPLDMHCQSCQDGTGCDKRCGKNSGLT